MRYWYLNYKKHNNPGLSKGTKNIYTYFNSFPFDNFQKQWRQSKEFDIDNMMERCKVKSCKNASFGTHTVFWDHCLGKSVSG